MKPWYAIGARRLLEDRQQGIVPVDPVSVVLGDTTEAAPAIYVKADMPVDRLDWRMLVNLPVWVWAGPGVEVARLLRICRAIAAVRPSRLTVRMEAQGQVHDVDVGHGLHCRPIGTDPAVHEFTWTPMDLTRTELGAKLRRALVAELPMWSAL